MVRAEQIASQFSGTKGKACKLYYTEMATGSKSHRWLFVTRTSIQSQLPSKNERQIKTQGEKLITNQ